MVVVNDSVSGKVRHDYVVMRMMFSKRPCFFANALGLFINELYVLDIHSQLVCWDILQKTITFMVHMIMPI